MKPELKLAYQSGAIAALGKLENLDLPEDAKAKVLDAIEKDFEEWYQQMFRLFSVLGPRRA